MAIDFTGIRNVNEYYTNHYLVQYLKRMLLNVSAYAKGKRRWKTYLWSLCVNRKAILCDA